MFLQNRDSFAMLLQNRDSFAPLVQNSDMNNKIKIKQEVPISST